MLFLIKLFISLRDTVTTGVCCISSKTLANKQLVARNKIFFALLLSNLVLLFWFYCQVMSLNLYKMFLGRTQRFSTKLFSTQWFSFICRYLLLIHCWRGRFCLFIDCCRMLMEMLEKNWPPKNRSDKKTQLQQHIYES